MKRKTAVLLGLALLLTAGVLALPYAAWRLIAWIIMDEEEQ